MMINPDAIVRVNTSGSLTCVETVRGALARLPGSCVPLLEGAGEAAGAEGSEGAGVAVPIEGDAADCE